MGARLSSEEDRIARLETGGQHSTGLGIAAAEVAGITDRVIHIHAEGIAACREQRCQHKSAGRNEGPLPFEFAGEPVRGTLEAAEALDPQDVYPVEPVALDVGKVEIGVEFAAQDRLRCSVGIVEDLRDRLLVFVEAVWVGILNVEIEGPQVEIIAFSKAREIGLVHIGRAVEGRQIVGLGEVVVRLDEDVPAEAPARIDLEFAPRRDHAAIGFQRVHGSRCELLPVQLADAGDVQRMQAVVELLPELTFQEKTLAGQPGAGDCRVHVGRDRPVVGHSYAGAELLRVAELREQEATLALDCMVRDFHHRNVGDRLAEELEIGVLEPNGTGASVLNDSLGLDVPQRAMFRLGVARRAGGVDSLVEDEFLAIASFAGFRRQARQIRRFDPEGLDEAVAEVVGDVHSVGINDVAARLDELDVAGREDAAGFLVVIDLPGHHLVAAVFDLHIAAYGHLFRVAIVDELIGGQQQLGVGRNIRLQFVDSRPCVLRLGWRIHSDGKHMQRHACKQGSVGKLHAFAVACRH